MPAVRTSIALGAHNADYARGQVASGAYASASEVVRDALRLHEEHTLRRAKLLSAIDDGLASPLVDFDMRGWIDQNYTTE